MTRLAESIVTQAATAGPSGPESSGLRVRATAGRFSVQAGGDACALHMSVPVASTGGIRLQGALAGKHYFEAKVQAGSGARVGVANGRCIFAGLGEAKQLGESEGSWALDVDSKKVLAGGAEQAVAFGLGGTSAVVTVGVLLDLENDTLNFTVDGHAVALGGDAAIEGAPVVKGLLLAAAMLGGGLRPSVSVMAPYCVGLALGNGHGDRLSQQAPDGFRAFGLLYRPGLASLLRTAQAFASGSAEPDSAEHLMAAPKPVRQHSDEIGSPMQQMSGTRGAITRDIAKYSQRMGAEPLNDAPMYLGSPSLFSGASALGDLDAVESTAKGVLQRTSEPRPSDPARVFVSGVQLVPRAGLSTDAIRELARDGHAISPLRCDGLVFDADSARNSTGTLLGEKAAMEAICVADSVAKSGLGA